MDSILEMRASHQPLARKHIFSTNRVPFFTVCAQCLKTQSFHNRLKMTLTCTLLSRIILGI